MKIAKAGESHRDGTIHVYCVEVPNGEYVSVYLEHVSSSGGKHVANVRMSRVEARELVAEIVRSLEGKSGLRKEVGT